MKNLQLTTDFLDYNIDIYLINRLLKRSFNVMKPSFATHLLQKRTGLKPILEFLGEPESKTDREFGYYLGYLNHGINTGRLTLKFENNKVTEYSVWDG